MRRDELLAGYRHPYRRWLPAAWRLEKVPWTLGAAAAAGAATAAAEATGDAPGALELASVVVGVVALARTAIVTAAAAALIRERIRDWRPSDQELARVRERRPHADQRDAVVVHEEYAVAAVDDELVTWCYRPLRWDEAPHGDETLIGGTPRHGARVHAASPYDPVDAARAAEQLVAAQELARVLEAEAIEGARRRHEEHQRARELADEAQSTGAALRRVTGQAE